jgi:hypothetical protein
MKYYKFLTADNKGACSNFDFTKYLPKDGKPGKWLPKIKNVEMCESGYHAFKLGDILEWCDSQLFEVELRGVSIIGDTKTVAQQLRFIRKVDTWNDKTARLFACYCARDVLPIFEKKYPDDSRPRTAIETAERYANGEATDEELAAALDAAWAAAKDAAMAASWNAALDTAWNAARAAARDAARAAARDAAWVAAIDAAWDAARVAAKDAAKDAARVAAWAKYSAHLIEMLGLEDE